MSSLAFRGLTRRFNARRSAGALDITAAPPLTAPSVLEMQIVAIKQERKVVAESEGLDAPDFRQLAQTQQHALKPA